MPKVGYMWRYLWRGTGGCGLPLSLLPIEGAVEWDGRRPVARSCVRTTMGGTTGSSGSLVPGSGAPPSQGGPDTAPDPPAHFMGASRACVVAVSFEVPTSQTIYCKSIATYRIPCHL